jgi:uncharacterized protein YjbJ (UPF0337 family)
MNWDQVAGNWKQFKGNSMKLWGGITHDEFGVMMGRNMCTDGRIQKSYGINKEKAAKQLAEWMSEHQLMLRSHKH